MFRALVYETQPHAVQTINLVEFRSRLEIPDEKYKGYTMFKKRVLETAERDINQKTDIFLKFTEVKGRGKGGRIESLHISVILKAHMVHEYDSYLVWQKDDLLEKLQVVVLNKKGQRLELKVLSEYSQETIARLLYEVINETVNLTTINNCQKFFEYLLSEWKTDMGMAQVTMDDCR
jgi:plasmid replication initiation protein